MLGALGRRAGPLPAVRRLVLQDNRTSYNTLPGGVLSQPRLLLQLQTRWQSSARGRTPPPRRPQSPRRPAPSRVSEDELESDSEGGEEPNPLSVEALMARKLVEDEDVNPELPTDGRLDDANNPFAELDRKMTMGHRQHMHNFVDPTTAANDAATGMFWSIVLAAPSPPGFGADYLVLDVDGAKAIGFRINTYERLQEVIASGDVERMANFVEGLGSANPTSSLWLMVFVLLRRKNAGFRQMHQYWQRMVAQVGDAAGDINPMIPLLILDAADSQLPPHPFLFELWEFCVKYADAFSTVSLFSAATAFLRTLRHFAQPEHMQHVMWAMRVLENPRRNKDPIPSTGMADKVPIQQVLPRLQQILEPNGQRGKPFPVSPDSTAFFSLLKCLSHAGSMEHALGYFLRVVTYYPEKVSRRAISWLVMRFGAYLPEQVLPILKLLLHYWPAQSSSAHVFGIAMRIFAKDLVALQMLYDQMVERNIPRTHHIYVQIMSSYNSMRQYADSLRWYEIMIKDLGTTETNEFVLHVVMVAFSKSFRGRVSRPALKGFDPLDVLEKQLTLRPLNKVLVNSLMVYFSNIGSIDVVLRTWNYIVDNKLVPNEYITNTVVTALARRNLIEELSQVIRDFTAATNSPLHDIHMSSMLRHLEPGAAASFVNDILRRLRENAEDMEKMFNDRAMSTMFSFLATNRDMDGFLRILELMLQRNRMSPGVLNRILRELVDEALRQRPPDLSFPMTLLQHMTRVHCKLDLGSTVRMLRVAVVVGDQDMIAHWLEAFLTFPDVQLSELLVEYPQSFRDLRSSRHVSATTTDDSPDVRRDGLMLAMALQALTRVPNAFMMPVYRNLIGMYPEFECSPNEITRLMGILIRGDMQSTLGLYNEVFRHVLERNMNSNMMIRTLRATMRMVFQTAAHEKRQSNYLRAIQTQQDWERQILTEGTTIIEGQPLNPKLEHWRKYYVGLSGRQHSSWVRLVSASVKQYPTFPPKNPEYVKSQSEVYRTELENDDEMDGLQVASNH